MAPEVGPTGLILFEKWMETTREGYRWLARLAAWAPGACLADDMGLGKTVQALALLLRRARIGPALVVAPTSVGINWEREAGRFTPKLRVRHYRGPGREQLLRHAGPGQMLVTSYALLSRDREALASVEWATVVLDEAQAIKHADTARARAARGLSSSFTLALTGTPLENRADELWSLFSVIVPGLLGDRAAFDRRFGARVEMGDRAARKGLAALLRPFLLRRLKGEVAQDLPPRTELTVDVTLSTRERRIGQTQPVTVYRFISAGTVEASILELQATKRELASAVLEGAGAASQLGADELLALLADASQPSESEPDLPIRREAP